MNFSKRKAEKRKEELREIARREGNKFCFECNQRGPLYVVFPFTIFVCSTCAAVHRSFQHKVKGTSMCEFTDDELARLRVGGNDRAFLIWIGNDENAIKSNKFNMDCSYVMSEGLVYNFIESVFQSRRFFNAAQWEKFEEDVAGSNQPVQPTQQSNILKSSFNNKPSSSSSFNLISSDTNKTKSSTILHNTSSSTLCNSSNIALHSTTEVIETQDTDNKEKGNSESNNGIADDLFVSKNAEQTKTLEDIFTSTTNTKKLTHQNNVQATIKSESATQMSSLTTVQENNMNNNNNNNNNSTTQSVLDDLFASTSPEVPVTTTTTTTTTWSAGAPPALQNFTDYYSINSGIETNINNSNNFNSYNTSNLSGNVETKELFSGNNNNTNIWNLCSKSNNSSISNNNNNYKVSETNNFMTNMLPQVNFTGGYPVTQQSNSLHHVNFLQEPPPQQQQQFYQTATINDPWQQVSMTPMAFQDNNFCSSNVNTTTGGNLNNNMFDWTGKQQQQQQEQTQEQKVERTQESNPNAFASLNPFMSL